MTRHPPLAAKTRTQCACKPNCRTCTCVGGLIVSRVLQSSDEQECNVCLKPHIVHRNQTPHHAQSTHLHGACTSNAPVHCARGTQEQAHTARTRYLSAAVREHDFGQLCWPSTYADQPQSYQITVRCADLLQCQHAQVWCEDYTRNGVVCNWCWHQAKRKERGQRKTKQVKRNTTRHKRTC